MDNQKSIVISSTFAAEPLRVPLSFWLNRLKLAARLVFAPELQLIQNLLDAGSALNANMAGLNVVLLRWQDVDASGCAADHAFRDVTESLRVAVRAEVPLLVLTCPSSPGSAAAARAHAFSHWDQRLVREFDEDSRVSVMPASELQNLYPIASPFEFGGDEFALLPYSPATFSVLATWIARKFHMLTTAPYKVIAVDCDDTLWDGACGEEGPHGVRLQAAHLEFQQFLRSQLQQGWLISLCSKNNPEDVEAVFRERSDMILHWEDIAATKINWRLKAENLIGLAGELGLGTDSFIFIDDNPIECEMMRQSLPNVLTLKPPADKASLQPFLRRVWAFDRPAPTAEDRKRVSFYRRERERKQLRQNSATLEEFIAGLDLTVEFRPLSDENLCRASQLTFRVNQFNVTTIRRSEAELAGLRRSNSLDGWVVDVSDRFGAYGLVGLVLFRPARKSLQVDTFLLSCRALGRGVEHRMAVELARRAKSLGLDCMDFSFVASGKNQPGQEFLESEFGDYGRSVGVGVEYRIPVEAALAVRYSATRKKALISIPIDHRMTLQESGDFHETRAETLAWIAEELPTGDAIQTAIADSTRQESGSREFIPPRTDSEHQIAGIWSEVLGLTNVGLRDNFFEIGGDSLAMVRVILRVNEVTGFELPIRAFFDAPTIEQQLLRFPICTRSMD
jgi:FkbH-like protein